MYNTDILFTGIQILLHELLSIVSFTHAGPGVQVSLESGQISGTEASLSIDICVVMSLGVLNSPTTVTLSTIGGTATSTYQV